MPLPSSLWHLATPVVGLAANATGQVLLFRCTRVGLLRSVVLGFALSLAVTLGLDIWGLLAFPGEGGLALVPFNALLCATLGYGYFHFVNLGETARRARLMRELAAAPDGLTEAELLSRYNAREILAKRLKRLISKGQLTVRNDRLFVKKSPMLYISMAMTLAKQALLGKKSEFD